MTDPWLVREKTINQESVENSPTDTNSNETNFNLIESQTSLQFEDNFLPTHNILNNASSNKESTQQPSRLPDSEDYLQSLEKKLKKIKKNPKILEALSEKRAECLRNLLEDNLFINKDESLELDAPISSGDSAVQELYRHIQPVQALSVGETVHIVKYDQLEAEEEVEGEQQPAQEDSNSESNSP
ncbi:coiled-coil domain-containing protein 32 [Episyrphus balteatus]|uniref:coiled-coil domain-containing protein 32 n=1 Tax=Episyrphus balteatus TaxID=286459 RepID=UPI0024855AD8|nr:coiled-coil domain-containing protein 32 [Episyrphus balteatus]